MDISQQEEFISKQRELVQGFFNVSGDFYMRLLSWDFTQYPIFLNKALVYILLKSVLKGIKEIMSSHYWKNSEGKIIVCFSTLDKVLLGI